jgi:uncharacterized membrane protein
MLAVLIAVQWLHVLGGIFWFGSTLTNNVVVIPAIKAQTPESQKTWWRSYSSSYGKMIAAVAGATIVLGIVRGLIGGVWSVLGSAYGLTWIASLLLGIGLALVGARLTGPTAEKLASEDQASYGANLDRLGLLGRFELGLFVLLFSLMIAMRFGY